MGVGGLLDLLVVPSSLRVVRPGDHVIQQVVGVGMALDGAVDHGHCLGTGNVLLGSEGAVLIPIHDAGVGGLVDVILGPVTLNVREEVFAIIGGLEEAGRNGGKLGTGDVPVGLKGAVLVAVQHPGVGEGGDGIVEPVVGAHVAVGVGLAPILIPALVGEEAEEDGGHFGTGDVALGLDAAVLVAHDVGIVVLGVQLGLIGVHRGTDGGMVGIDGGCLGVSACRRFTTIGGCASHRHCIGQVAAGIGAQDLVGGGDGDSCVSLQVTQVNGVSASRILGRCITIEDQIALTVEGIGDGNIVQCNLAVFHRDGVGEGVIHRDAATGVGLAVNLGQSLGDLQFCNRVGSLFVDQREGGEAVGCELNVLLISITDCNFINDAFASFHVCILNAQLIRIHRVFTVHTRVVHDMEFAVCSGVLRDRPVDEQRLIVAHGNHSVAVLGVYQVHVGQVVGGVRQGVALFKCSVDFGNSIVAHGCVEVGVVGHLVYQELDTVALVLNLDLTVVDVVVDVAIRHCSSSFRVGYGILVSSNGVGVVNLIHHTADGEFAGPDLDVTRDALFRSFFAHSEFGLDLALFQFARIDRHIIGLVDLGGTHIEVIRRHYLVAILELQADRNFLIVLRFTCCQRIDILSNLTGLRVRGIDSLVLHAPFTGSLTNIIGKRHVVRQVSGRIFTSRTLAAFLVIQPFCNRCGKGDVIAGFRQARVGFRAANEVSASVYHAAVILTAGVDGDVGGGDGYGVVVHADGLFSRIIGVSTLLTNVGIGGVYDGVLADVIGLDGVGSRDRDGVSTFLIRKVRDGQSISIYRHILRNIKCKRPTASELVLHRNGFKGYIALVDYGDSVGQPVTDLGGVSREVFNLLLISGYRGQSFGDAYLRILFREVGREGDDIAAGYGVQINGTGCSREARILSITCVYCLGPLVEEITLSRCCGGTGGGNGAGFGIGCVISSINRLDFLG